MRVSTKVLAAGLLAALLACWNDPPKVLQGKVVSYDEAKKQLVLADELAPSPPRMLDASKAQFGAPPAPGNLVRVAYHERDGVLVAGRVMNVKK